MPVLNLDGNGVHGDNGTGKLFMCTDWEGETFPDGNGTNETASISTLKALTYTDLWYFENFETIIKDENGKTITTDYCGVGEISDKSETSVGFKVDTQEILEMNNLAQILGAKLNKTESGKEVIGIKNSSKTKPYFVFKFETCPKDGKKNVFYFVKVKRSGDINMSFVNLSREDFVGVTLEFEWSKGGNFFIEKEVDVPTPPTP